LNDAHDGFTNMSRTLVIEARMVTVSLAQAKTRLGELLDTVEAGEEVIVSRHGRAIARISPVTKPKKLIDYDGLAAFRATMPSLSRPSVELIREMRDDER
jgi:prevent-host-death family protein